MKKTLLSIAALLCLYFTYAQPGELDRSFGGKGMVITDVGANIGNNTEPSPGLLLLPDGSMYLTVTSNGLGFVSKYYANGSPDLTYGKAGYSAGVAIVPAQMVQQADGKIIVAGTTPAFIVGGETYTDFAIVRFNTDGSLDSSFGGKAYLTFHFLKNNNGGGVAIQNDGKIVFVGTAADYSYPLANTKILLFNTDGTVEKIFGTNGSYNDLNQADAVALQSDGKIVVGGTSLWRYNADGTPDNSFGSDGRVGGIQVFSIGLQSNGKIVIRNDYPGFDGFVITRFNDDGSLDTGFGQGGAQGVDFGGTAHQANSMAIQTDDKIILGGYVNYNGNRDIAIARFDMNGNLDNGFSGDGKQVLNLGAANDEIIAMAVRNDGKIIVTARTNNGVNNVAGVTRFNTNGDPDNSFGGDGIVLLEPAGQKSTIYTSTAVQADGKALAAGFAWNGSSYDFAVVRYNINGGRDQTFSGDGKQMSDFGGTDDRVAAIAIQADGKIVVAGSSGSNFALARYNTDGSPDNSFDGDGLLTGNFGASLTSLVIQPDGKIIVGGARVVVTGAPVLVRFNTDGSLDTGFDGDGKLTLPFDCNAITLQADGKILVAGGPNYIMVGRYNIDGSPDESFGENGSIFLQLDETSIAKAIAVQPDGKIVIGGSYIFADRNYYTYFLLTRLNSDGSFDNTFAGGVIHTVYNGNSTTMAIQGDGKIIVGGYSPATDNGPWNFTLARFTKDGVLDNTFSGDGVQTTPIGPTESKITAIALSKDKLYAVGISGVLPGTSGAIARYSLCGCHETAVQLPEFKAVPQQRTIVLQWQVASDVAMENFTIERGGDSATFSPIGYVSAEENHLQLTYSTIDKKPLPGLNFYRLKMVDKEGRISFSNIISVMMNDAGVLTLNVFPNPAKTTLYISKNGVSEKATIRIIDGNGRLLKEGKIFLSNNAPMPVYINNLPKGLYILQINTATNKETRKFIKE